MNKISFIVAIVVAIVVTGCMSTKVTEDSRDYAYEAYCDSIYNANPDYYLDVLCETDEYCNYLEKHGEWWDE